MIKGKKICTLLLCSVMSVSLLGGCKNDKQVSKDPNNTGSEERVKLTFCMSQTGWGGEAVDPELMKEVERIIEEKTNTDLTIIAPPQSSYNDKLNTLLTSDIPDIFAVRKAMDTLQVMAARGYTRSMDDLIKTAPEITSLVDPKYLDYLTVDGKLHAVPMYVPLSKVIWLRKDVMDECGVNLSQTPTTEEFYNEMKKMVGKGVIPFTFPKFLDNLPFFFNPFGAYYGIGVDENGKFYDGFNTPEAKEALSYVAKLYAEGIWDQEFITNENAIIREKLFSGKAASTLDYFNRYIYYINESEKVNAGTEFVPVYELVGPRGDRGNLNEAIQDVLCISSKTKHPEKAMEVIKYYFYTMEGVKLRCLGVEGKHFTIEDGRIKATEKAANSGYKSDVNSFLLYYPKIDNYGFKWDETTERLLPKQMEYVEEANKHLGSKYLVPGGKSALYDKNLSAYKKKIDEISSKIILGTTTVEKGYEEYEKFWKSIKGDEMLEQLNK